MVIIPSMMMNVHPPGPPAIFRAADPPAGRVSMGTAAPSAPSQAVDVARAVCLATAAAFESGPPEG